MSRSDILFDEQDIDVRANSVEMADVGGNKTVELRAEAGVVRAGGNGKDGIVLVNDAEGNRRMAMGGNGVLGLRGDDEEGPTVRVSGNSATGIFGGNGAAGSVEVADDDNDVQVELDAEESRLSLAAEDDVTVEADGANAEVSVGGFTESGRLSVVEMQGFTDSREIDLDASGHAVELLHVNSGFASTSEDVTARLDGQGTLELGVDGGGTGSANVAGESVVRDSDGNDRVSIRGGGAGVASDRQVRVDVDGRRGSLSVGGNGAAGTLALENADGNTTGEFRGDAGQFVTGGDGTAGSVMLRNAAGGVGGFVRADGDGLALLDGDGNLALKVEPGGVVKTSSPVERF